VADTHRCGVFFTEQDQIIVAIDRKRRRNMKKRSSIVRVVAPAILQIPMVLSIASVAQASDYPLSNIALTPGANASELNFAWTTSDSGTGQCVVGIAKASTGFKNSTIFAGTKAGGPDTNIRAPTDSRGEPYCRGDDVVLGGSL
jgi:hypothetical protein